MSAWHQLDELDEGHAAWIPYLRSARLTEKRYEERPHDGICVMSPTWTHGTDAAYHHGCHCPGAKEAHKAHMARKAGHQ